MKSGLNAAVLLLAAMMLGACATKGDVRMLREDVATMAARQDSVLQDIQRQNRLLLDSIRTTMAMTVDVRGSTSNQMRSFEQSVQRQGEMLTQIMAALSRIDARLTTLEERPPAAGAAGAAPAGDVEQMYTLGMQKMREQSYGTAIAAFEQVIAQYPDHPRAAEAQFQIGEAYQADEEYADAYAAFEQVVERWRTSPRAPAALFRAGVIAEEQRDVARARRYYTRIREAYAGSDEARQAQTRLGRLPNR